VATANLTLRTKNETFYLGSAREVRETFSHFEWLRRQNNSLSPTICSRRPGRWPGPF